MIQTRESDLYFVVRNGEEQYSIWPSLKALPQGWISIGEAAAKEACLSRIEQIWTDIRPLSVREAQAIG